MTPRLRPMTMKAVQVSPPRGTHHLPPDAPASTRGYYRCGDLPVQVLCVCRDWAFIARDYPDGPETPNVVARTDVLVSRRKAGDQQQEE